MEQRRGEKILRRFAPQNDKGGAGHSLCHSQHFALSFRAFCAVVLCFFTLSFWAFLRCHPERSEGSALQSVRERTETILHRYAPRRQKKPSTFRLRCRLHIPWFLLPFPNRTRFAGLRFGLSRGCRAAESFVLSQPCRKKPSTFRLRCRLHIPWFLLPFPNRTRFAGLRFGLDGGYRAAESSALCQPR